MVRRSKGVRRRIQIRVAFAPTRLSAEYLRAVYEILVPPVERTVRMRPDTPMTGSSEREALQQQQQQQQQRRRTR